MSKSIIIIGAGTGISLSVAEKFGKEGFVIGLISRSSTTNDRTKQHLSSLGIESFAAIADAGNPHQLTHAIALLKKHLGSIKVLVYNAAVMKSKDILLESSTGLVDDFRVNVGGALDSVNTLLPDLKENQGSVIFTGGGIANYPNPLNGSLSIGKAGIRNLALQLHNRLKQEGIFVGTLTINNGVSPGSTTHTPLIAAGKIWELAQKKDIAELQW